MGQKSKPSHISHPTRQLAEACNNNERTDGPHASLEAMITTMHRATNRGAANTRRWFAEDNQALRAGEAG
jgi:hypothetical protein